MSKQVRENVQTRRKNREGPRRPAGAGGRVDAWDRLVIGAADVPKMLNGDEVTIHFVQQRPGREPFIGYAGSARISRSGKAINVEDRVSDDDRTAQGRCRR